MSDRGPSLRTSALRRPVMGASLSLLVLAVTTLWVVCGPPAWDSPVRSCLIGQRTSSLTLVAWWATGLGSIGGVAILGLAGGTTLFVLTRRMWPTALLLGTIGASVVLVYSTKVVVARTRPPITDLQSDPSTHFSFPSGHTADGTTALLLTALLLVGWLRRRWLRAVISIAAGVLAVVIGLSRVYLGYHWPSDVLASWSLAAVLVGVACLVDRVRNQVESELPADSCRPPAGHER